MVEEATAAEEKRKSEARERRKKRLEGETEKVAGKDAKQGRDEEERRRRKNRRKDKKREADLEVANAALEKHKRGEALSAIKPQDLHSSFTEFNAAEDNDGNGNEADDAGDDLGSLDLTLSTKSKKKVHWDEGTKEGGISTSKQSILRKTTRTVENNSAAKLTDPQEMTIEYSQEETMEEKLTDISMSPQLLQRKESKHSDPPRKTAKPRDATSHRRSSTNGGTKISSKDKGKDRHPRSKSAEPSGRSKDATSKSRKEKDGRSSSSRTNRHMPHSAACSKCYKCYHPNI